MFRNLSGMGSMMPEATDQDVEKGEQSSQSTKNEIEIAEEEPHVYQQDHVEDECSTKAGVNGHNDEEVACILTNMKGLLIDIGAKSPKLTKEEESSCCIFKIPHSLKKIHQKGYEPEIVSIGPFHRDKKHLQKMIEEHKHQYLQLFLDKVKDGVDTEFLGKKILEMEIAIRNSYSEKLVGVKQPELLKMMLLDGCFILMLFFFIARKVDSHDDRILTTPWILATIQSDLLLLENQVPFILLETLLEESSLSSDNLESLAFNFFNLSAVTKEKSCKPKHLLDLIRKNFIPRKTSQNPQKTSQSPQNDSRLILSAKRLRLQGIKFKASKDHFSSKENTLLNIRLVGKELRIPTIVFDGFISSVFLNCVAFEQLSMKCPNDITSYVVFMGCLMNEEADANYLKEKGIIDNYFGNGSEVCHFFKNICKDVAFDIGMSYLKEEFKGINKYTSKKWNVERARFYYLHFDSPWTILSSSVVVLAICLSITQTILAILRFSSHHM